MTDAPAPDAAMLSRERLDTLLSLIGSEFEDELAIEAAEARQLITQALAAIDLARRLEEAERAEADANAARDAFADAAAVQKDRADQAEAALVATRLQAQNWKMEAMAHKSSMHEAYQAATGATGEPGNWNGAEPIKTALAAARAEGAEAMREAILNLCRNFTGTTSDSKKIFAVREIERTIETLALPSTAAKPGSGEADLPGYEDGYNQGHFDCYAENCASVPARIAELEAALREIDDMTPATADMTVAHMMGDIARAALAQAPQEGEPS